MDDTDRPGPDAGPEPPSGAGARRSGSAADDPMSADRRTLLIAAVAVLAFLAIGVVSAEVFTRSACGPIQPEAVPGATSPATGAPVGDEATRRRLADVLGDLAPEEIERTVAELDGLLEGTTADIAAVGPATGLRPAGDGLVATGPRLSLLLPPSGRRAAAIGAVAEVDDPAHVVGSGATLYSLALVDEATAQVDAIVPLSEELVGGDCFDTAQVGVPLAFHLDAGGGELLVLRVDDEGELPEVELRDAGGPVWSERVQLRVGPPGALAARLDGKLGEDLVVTARRTSGDGHQPAIEARTRSSGAQRWTVAPAQVAELAPPGDEALEIEVVAVTERRVLVAVSREERGPVRVLGLDATDGRPAWVGDLEAHATPRLVSAADDHVLVVVREGRGGDQVPVQRLVRVDLDDGSASGIEGLAGHRARAAATGDAVLLAVDDTLAMVPADGRPRSVSLPLEVADVAVVDGAVAVLLRHGDDGAVVWARR